MTYDVFNSARRHRAAIIHNICGAMQMMTIDDGGGGGDCCCSYRDVTIGVNALRVGGGGTRSSLIRIAGTTVRVLVDDLRGGGLLIIAGRGSDLSS